jgi:hypothetical protein
MTAAPSSPRAYLKAVPVGGFVRINELPWAKAAASVAASRAAQRGELVFVRRGLYFKGVRTQDGMTRPTEHQIAEEFLGTRGVGPAGLSAARALGVTTQIPGKPEFAVVRGRSGALQGMFLIHTRKNLARLDLTAQEIALLEVLRDPETLVESGWPALILAVKELATAAAIRLPEVATAVRAEPNESVRLWFGQLTVDLADALIRKSRAQIQCGVVDVPRVSAGGPPQVV